MAVLNVSMGLPFANRRLCSAACIEKALTLSDHRDASFGQAYGVLVKELRLLARTSFVVGKDGLVKHAEVVPEMTHHPDYDKALAAAKSGDSGTGFTGPPRHRRRGGLRRPAPRRS